MPRGTGGLRDAGLPLAPVRGAYASEEKAEEGFGWAHEEKSSWAHEEKSCGGLPPLADVCPH